MLIGIARDRPRNLFIGSNLRTLASGPLIRRIYRDKPNYIAAGGDCEPHRPCDFQSSSESFRSTSLSRDVLCQKDGRDRLTHCHIRPCHPKSLRELTRTTMFTAKPTMSNFVSGTHQRRGSNHAIISKPPSMNQSSEESASYIAYCQLFGRSRRRCLSSSR